MTNHITAALFVLMVAAIAGAGLTILETRYAQEDRV